MNVHSARGAKRAFNFLLALMRRAQAPVARNRATRREERKKLSGLIAHHGGRVDFVRDAIVSTQRVTTERLFCKVCNRVTDYRAGRCRNQHTEKHCPSCGMVTVRRSDTGQCLEPTHREPMRAYCYHCHANRTFNAQNNCQSCGQKHGSTPTAGWW